MRDLAAQLQSAGVDVDLIEVPFADHAFDGPANGVGMQLVEAVLPAFLEKATTRR
jgi:acetyl esterase/lipase